jgi:lysine N6-hydroxylase
VDHDDGRQVDRAWRGKNFRCVGIGVGPANLSLVSLMHSQPGLTNLFLERRDTFGWHDGQQIDGAQLQVSMLKDLVSLSDPTNPYSFLAYLHAQGRMYHFLNAQFEAVPRAEFRDYFAWAAERNPNVVFGQQVRSVEFDGRFVISTDDGTVTADNISVAVGCAPRVPTAAVPHLGASQFHVSDYLSKARGLGGKRVGVVGGGQSGAEAFLDLVTRDDNELPRRITWISRRPNFLPLDDSPFTNDYYMPGHSDYFATLPLETRREFNARHLLTSDGISESTLRSIYQAIYIRRFIRNADDLIALYPNRSVVDVVPDATSGGWDLTLSHLYHPDIVERQQFDVVVWATGYHPADTEFLAPIADRFEYEDGEYKIDRNFAVEWDGPPTNNVFIQNAARQQRGLADPNLSLLAWRSQRILDRICGTQSEDPLSSFIEWTTKPPTAQYM